MRDWSGNPSREGVIVSGGGIAWSAAQFEERVYRIGEALQARTARNAPVALLADNSPEWIAVDIATRKLGLTLVPLPSFFTPAQVRHAIEASGVHAMFCQRAVLAHGLGFTREIFCGGGIMLYESDRDSARTDLHGIQKITFTSGTTAEPKGVCLTAEQQWNLAHALQASLSGLGIERHLALLPLAVLLENIAGAYTAMLSGATLICPPLSEAGLTGAAQFDAGACLDAIHRHQAHSIILLPQMLLALIAASKTSDERIRSLKFAAVGGAKSPPALIAAARQKGFPVFEGYGLSECGSVVSLNLPGRDRPGSVGKPLPNRRVRIAADGEIEVGGETPARYLGAAPECREWLPTGDIGHLDDDGFLYIDGRKKNILITAFGRNVSPEWPESVLLGTGIVAQAVVFGDARPYLVAVIVPLSNRHGIAAIQEAVAKANRMLPDYARIHRWTTAERFSPENGLATPNGRPRREAIWERFKRQIEPLYQSSGE